MKCDSSHGRSSHITLRTEAQWPIAAVVLPSVIALASRTGPAVCSRHGCSGSTNSSSSTHSSSGTDSGSRTNSSSGTDSRRGTDSSSSTHSSSSTNTAVLTAVAVLIALADLVSEKVPLSETGCRTLCLLPALMGRWREGEGGETEGGRGGGDRGRETEGG